MSPFEPVAEIVADPRAVTVYEEGWQSWSPAGVRRADSTSPRPPDATRQTMGWRPLAQLPGSGFQGEGVLVVAPPDDDARAWFAPKPAESLPSIRLAATMDRVLVSADGPVLELTAPGLIEALALVGERLRPQREIRSLQPGWSSWSFYFRNVTEADIAENLDAAGRLGLPIEIVQIDDGWQAEIGDWLDVSPRFGSLESIAARIRDSGRVPGIWTAPFLVGERSRCAREHPEWLLDGVDAGENWGQRLRVLDVTHPDAAAYLQRVYGTLAELGFGFHKLDFLYAGALRGIDSYRSALHLIADASGGATLLACGAPLLPSIGLVDAMRVGPDVIGEDPATWSGSIRHAEAVTRARAWMHTRLWVNDPDHLLARREIGERERWAAHVRDYGGLALSGDRLDALDDRGLELTREALRPSTREPA